MSLIVRLSRLTFALAMIVSIIAVTTSSALSGPTNSQAPLTITNTTRAHAEIVLRTRDSSGLRPS